MRWVAEAVIALSAASDGFTASELAARVCTLGKQTPAQYGPTRAAYDLKKFRGQQIVHSGSARPATMRPRRQASGRSPLWLFSEIRPLNRFSPLPRNSDQGAAHRTRHRSTRTTTRFEQQCEECSMSSA
jgi:hypothetical protein